MRDVIDVGKGRGNEDIPLALLGEDLFALTHNIASVRVMLYTVRCVCNCAKQALVFKDVVN
jgi:hypothetical protein